MPAVTDIIRTDPMCRAANKGLMVAWINADLAERGNCDVRRSYVLYDEDKMFVYALPERPTDEQLAAIAARTSVRYISRGIV